MKKHAIRKLIACFFIYLFYSNTKRFQNCFQTVIWI